MRGGEYEWYTPQHRLRERVRSGIQLRQNRIVPDGGLSGGSFLSILCFVHA